MKTIPILTLLAASLMAQDSKPAAVPPPQPIALSSAQQERVNYLAKEQEAAQQTYRAAQAEREIIRLMVCVEYGLTIAECGQLISTPAGIAVQRNPKAPLKEGKQ
jgi:hypothetical protein